MNQTMAARSDHDEDDHEYRFDDCGSPRIRSLKNKQAGEAYLFDIKSNNLEKSIQPRSCTNAGHVQRLSMAIGKYMPPVSTSSG